MALDQVLVLTLFVGVYVLFATRLLPPALAAVFGALVLALWNGLAFVLPSVVASVLIASAGLMVMAGFVKRSGWAAWLALKTIKLTQGRPWGILVLTGFISFVSGAFWGPLAAVILVAPVALLLAAELDIAPVPFVVILTWSALLGGVTVLTAQPSNLWIGAALGIDAGQWVRSVAPFTVAAFAVTLVTGALLFRKDLRATNERRARILEFDASKSLGDRPLVVKTAVVVLAVLGFLILSPWLALSPSVVLATGGLVLALWNRRTPLDKVLSDIDGATLLFYGGLFVVIGSLGVSGLPAALAQIWSPQPVTVLWAAALLGVFVDPGAVSGAGIPLLQGWARQGASLWPFLAIGAAIGGGVAVWGAVPKAALELAGTSRKASGWRFVAYGAVFAVVNLAAVSLVSLWVR